MGEKRFRTRKVFISYRREGGQAHAVNFCKGLTQVLGEHAVFLDVARDAMEVGQPWRSTVRAALARCDTLLLILDPGLGQRIQAPDNAVRFELVTALELGLRVAIVRVDNAVLPGASELPESLRHLPELHSPEVHRDSAIADVDRIIEWLTGVAPGTVKPLDRWDIAILLGFALVGGVAWQTWARDLFSIGEAWLWSGALAVPWVLWILVRRSMLAHGAMRSAANRRHAIAWLVVLLLLGAGWSGAWSTVYGVPEFPDQPGVLISRLENDPRNAAQGQLLRYFQPDVQITDGAAPASFVLPLPRRVGFASRTTPWIRHDSGHDDARRFGKSSGAAVVLWGAVLEREALASRIAANLTFIGAEGVFQRATSNVVGLVQLRELSDLDGNIAVLGRTLPDLISGYRAFHAATDERDLEFAQSKFERALASIDDRDSGAAASSVLRDLRASVLFYIGNTEQTLGRDESAAEWFERAMRETQGERGGPNAATYVHAANNLGWLQIKGLRYEDAIATFESTETECRGQPGLRACAYVWYNRGDAEIRLYRYSAAELQFERAIAAIAGRATQETDWILRGSAQQYLAFTLARQAAVAAAPEKNALLVRAEDEWRSGAVIYESRGVSVPDYHLITIARIHIERGEWQAAVDLLASLDAPDYDATVQALLAAAYACLGDIEKQLESIQALTGGNSLALTEEEWGEMARIEASCR
jgi:tetratricopeptide (TPR) repeat protein